MGPIGLNVEIMYKAYSMCVCVKPKDAKIILHLFLNVAFFSQL